MNEDVLRDTLEGQINRQYLEFKNSILNKSAEEIYRSAYEIVGMDTLYDFIYMMIDNFGSHDEELLEGLYPYRDNLLQDIYNFSGRYDYLNWNNPDDLFEIIENYIASKEVYNEN